LSSLFLRFCCSCFLVFQFHSRSGHPCLSFLPCHPCL
jgi:hypothetical protein